MKIKKRSDRVRKTIYVSESLYDAVRSKFSGISINRVIEELLREVMEKEIA